MEAVYGGRCVHEIYGVQACADFVGYQTCDCEIKDEEPSNPTDSARAAAPPPAAPRRRRVRVPIRGGDIRQFARDS
jgi:hypothetical protein